MDKKGIFFLAEVVEYPMIFQQQHLIKIMMYTLSKAINLIFSYMDVIPV